MSIRNQVVQIALFILLNQGIKLSNAVASELSLLRVKDTSIVFVEYDEAIAFQEKNKNNKAHLNQYARRIADEIWLNLPNAEKLDLIALRNYHSEVTEPIWSEITLEFKKRIKEMQCLGAHQNICSLSSQFYPQILFELMLAQTKTVYYAQSNETKKAAYGRATQTFSKLRSILEATESAASKQNILIAKAYLLASQLTNQPFFKLQFSHKANTHLAINIYGEHSFTEAKMRLLQSTPSRFENEANKLSDSLEPKFQNRLTAQDLLDTVVVNEFVALNSYVINDEKGKLLGDEWKLYNNSVPYFRSALENELAHLQNGKKPRWPKVKLINRSIKIEAYSAKERFKLVRANYRFSGQQTYESISKNTTWRSLAPYLHEHSFVLFRDEFGSSPSPMITVDDSTPSLLFANIRPFL